MAGTAVLERTPGVAPAAQRSISPAEAEHKRRIEDNYRKLRFGNPEDYLAAREGEAVDSAELVREPSYPAFEAAYDNAYAPAEPTYKPEETVYGADAAARMAQFTPVEAPAGHDLFANVTFKDGVLQGAEPMQKVEAPVQAAATVAQPAAPEAAESEDALPTRRTMDTLARPAAVAAAQPAKTHFFAALSARTKIVLAVVTAVILVAIMLIGINTSVINSMSAQISAKEAELQGLVRATEQVEGEIAEMTTPENVARWAEEHGLTRN